MPPLALNIEHVAIRVPDPGEAAEYCSRSLGLAITRRSEDTIHLTSRPADAVTVPPCELLFLRGEETVLDHVAFVVAEDDDLNAVRAAAVEQNVPYTDVVDPVRGTTGVRLTGPDGFLVDLFPQRPRIRRPAGDTPFDITRLGHLTVSAPEPAHTVAFFMETLGFHLSDQNGTNFFWVRCNRDHHGIGATRGRFGVHHVAFELRDWEQIRKACDHLRSSGLEVEFGPGRHGPGNNIFIYVLTPFGLRFELFCELERIDDDASYQPRDWGAGGRRTHANTWGPVAPASYAPPR